MSTWHIDDHWILDGIIAFFNTEHKQQLTRSALTLTKSPCTQGEIQYAVLDLSGPIRCTAHPETAYLVASKLDDEPRLGLIFQDDNKKGMYKHFENIPINPALRSAWLQGILGKYFDPSAAGHAILAAYDAEVFENAELQRQTDQATKAIHSLMEIHMRTCWASVCLEMQAIQHVNVLSAFQIREEMKKVTVKVMHSSGVPAMGTTASTGVASHLGDLMQRCERLGL